MFSDCAPNRNPAEISFAAVDRRLSPKQRDQVLALAKYYDADSYYCEFGSDETKQRAVSVYVYCESLDMGIAYVDRVGRVELC